MRKKIIKPGIYYSMGVININTEPEIFIIIVQISDDLVLFESEGRLFPYKKANTTYCSVCKKIPTPRVKNIDRYVQRLRLRDPFTVTYNGREIFKITDEKEVATITAALLTYKIDPHLK